MYYEIASFIIYRELDHIVYNKYIICYITLCFYFNYSFFSSVYG